MNLLGVRLTLLIGIDPLAIPAPAPVLDALREVEVSHSDRERSGFRLIFEAGRSGPLDLLDDQLLANPLLGINTRVILIVTLGLTPQVIMDGIVTQRDYSPVEGTITLTGKDITVAMEKAVKQIQHPAQDETVIANKIALSYPQYGVVPMVIPPVFIDPPLLIDRTPTQNCSDWGYLKEMAERHGYTTYCEAGPAPLMNTLYWGPPRALGLPQKALSVNMGAESTVSEIQFGHDALSAKTVQGSVKDRLTGKTVPVLSLVPTRPPLGLLPENTAHVGRQRSGPIDTSGLSMAQAFGQAQAQVDNAADDTITASGSLNTLKYNSVLKARAIVDLRGAGFSFDGSYLVRSVTHRIAGGEYKQDFKLSRNELGAKLPVVRTV